MSDASSAAWFGMSRKNLVERLNLIASDLNDLDSSERRSSIARIDYWSLARRAVPCLIGVSKSHPKIQEGATMFSSELFFLDETRSIARSFSRWYELGEQVPSNYWAERYPVVR